MSYVKDQLVPNLHHDHPNSNVNLDTIAKAPGLDMPITILCQSSSNSLSER
ncbi:hypothetical protein PGH45_00015 [Legionella pneumophila]|nr:hypothetical protein [Legionella pneumophila]